MKPNILNLTLLIEGGTYPLKDREECLNIELSKLISMRYQQTKFGAMERFLNLMDMKMISVHGDEVNLLPAAN